MKYQISLKNLKTLIMINRNKIIFNYDEFISESISLNVDLNKSIEIAVKAAKARSKKGGASKKSLLKRD